MKRLLLALLALAAASAGADTLPKGTKFIEYLESSGTQWINTGFSPSNKNVRIEVTYKFTKLPATGTRRYVFGSSFAVNTTNIRLQYAVGSAGKCFIGFGNTYKNDQTFDSYDTNTVHTIVCDGGVFSLDGTTSDEWDLSETTFAQTESDHPVYLFGHNVNNGSDPSQYLSSIRLYSCKIWDQGELVRDFIPAVTNDTFGCLYDKVNGRFYGNGGSGGFAAFGDEIPMEYRDASYIESDRTAYIDTEYKPNSKTEIEMKFSFTTTDVEKKTYVFGEYGSNGGRFQCSYGPNDQGCFFGYGGNNNFDNAVKGFDFNTNMHVVKYVRGEGFFFDGVKVVPKAGVNLTSWSGTAANLYLGWINPNNSWSSLDTSNLAPIRIYYCKIWEDGDLVRDLVPVQRVFDGKNGLHDNVTGNFYGYYGTRTDFTAFFAPAGLVIVVK